MKRKFTELRDFLRENKENGFRMMIADEMQYIIDENEEDGFEDEIFEMLCENAEDAYLKADEDVDIYKLCKTVYNMYKEGTLEGATSWDVINELLF